MPRKSPTAVNSPVAISQSTKAPAAKPAATRRSPSAARVARGASTAVAGAEEGPDLATRLAELTCDPIAIMAGIAADESADIKLRFAAAKELAAYLMAKPRTRGEPAPTSVDVGAIIARAWRGQGAGDDGP